MSLGTEHATGTVAAARAPMAVRMGRAIAALRPDDLPPAVHAKVRTCLMDFIGCAFEARHLPWSLQAAALCTPCAPGAGATLIGSPLEVSAMDAAFANAAMGHGLVREDMHAGSVSHLGIVVLPALLALAERHRIDGRTFSAAVAAGYEVGARFGRVAIDADLARTHRPTGITGPLAAAAGAARLLGLDAGATTTALALAANATGGLNQWAHTGGSEMFFHPGHAARGGLTAARLAQAGAFASPSALDGEAGLLASLGRSEGAPPLALFDGAVEILAVYHKPVPACNFAQTASQAAMALRRRHALSPEAIRAVIVRLPRASALYPGCDATGPFERALQAKMSIQYNVAGALLLGEITERNFAVLDDPRLMRLVAATTLEVDATLTSAFPGRQGAEVEVHLADGARHATRLDDVVHADAAQVRARFRAAVAEAVGQDRAEAVTRCIDTLEDADDAGALARLLRVQAAPAAGARA